MINASSLYAHRRAEVMRLGPSSFFFMRSHAFEAKHHLKNKGQHVSSVEFNSPQGVVYLIKKHPTEDHSGAIAKSDCCGVGDLRTC